MSLKEIHMLWPCTFISTNLFLGNIFRDVSLTFAYGSVPFYLIYNGYKNRQWINVQWGNGEMNYDLATEY